MLFARNFRRLDAAAIGVLSKGVRRSYRSERLCSADLRRLLRRSTGRSTLSMDRLVGGFGSRDAGQIGDPLLASTTASTGPPNKLGVNTA